MYHMRKFVVKKTDPSILLAIFSNFTIKKMAISSFFLKSGEFGPFFSYVFPMQIIYLRTKFDKFLPIKNSIPKSIKTLNPQYHAQGLLGFT